jgi:competence protein ComEC
MYLFTLGFLVGNVLIQDFSTLPDFFCVSLFFLGVVSVLCILRLLTKIIAVLPAEFYSSFATPILLGLSVGVFWTLWCANQVLDTYLPSDWIGNNITIQGVIDDVPNDEAGIVHFTFRISQAILPNGTIDTTSRRVQLSIKTENPLHAGEKWQWQVRLKPIHGNSNPGSFDVERWAFAQQIVARGYIVNFTSMQKLADASGFSIIQAWREQIAKTIANAAQGKDPQAYAILQALTVGVKTDIPRQTWKTLSQTGTSHLIAISGLHIALVAGLIGWLVKNGWACLPKASLYYPAQKAAAIASLLAALFYSALAGFSVPTQRTLVMVLVGCLSLLFEKPLLSWQTFCIALLAVIFWDPLATLTAGFWLSFGAVGFILLNSSGRLAFSNKDQIDDETQSWPNRIKKTLSSAFHTQKAVFLGLIPLSLVFFDGFSLISPLANAFAIPIVSFIVVPLALLGVVIQSISNSFALLLWKIAAITTSALLSVLHFLAQLLMAFVYVPSHNDLLLFSSFIAIFIFITRIIPYWYLSGIAFVALFLAKPEAVKSKEVKISLLDVGQGLSVVIQTQHHTLLYDTGASFLNGGSFAESVVVPFLKKQAIQSLDVMVLSHADNDHAGGVRDIFSHRYNPLVYKNAENYPMLTSQKGELCQNGTKWDWDGVSFEFVNPLVELIDIKRNDKSCVLRVTIGKYSILLPGDIERLAERTMIDNAIEKLPATILIAPHHGSRTSSSEAFLSSVAPEMILISAGYRNQYRLPSKMVLARYEKWQIPYLETAKLGTITILLNQDNGIYLVSNYREKHPHYWVYNED